MTTSDVFKVSLFILLSIGLIYISRSSLRAPLTHGFPRFIAWEAILMLFVINAQYWFQKFFSINQIC